MLRIEEVVCYRGGGSVGFETMRGGDAVGGVDKSPKLPTSERYVVVNSDAWREREDACTVRPSGARFVALRKN